MTKRQTQANVRQPQVAAGPSLAAVPARNRPDDGEAEPVVNVGVRACRVGAIEAVEQARQMLGIDRWTRVDNGQAGLLVLLRRDLGPYRALRGCEAGGVAQQVGNGPFDQGHVEGTSGISGHFDL